MTDELFGYHDIGFSSPGVIKKLQEKILRRHLVYCKKHSPYYRKQFKGFNFDNFSLNRLHELPFTEKADISRCNEDFLAVACDKIVDIVMTSGTTGLPLKMMYTGADLDRLAYNEKKSLAGCGITDKDKVLLTCTLDRCFIAGLAYFLGVRSIGAAAVRNGQSSLNSHAEIIKLMRPTIIVGVPSFLIKLGLYIADAGTDPRKTGVTGLVCIGEPVRNVDLKLLRTGKNLTNIWNANLFSTYASTETVTTFCECEQQEGGHLHPDLAIAEIVDELGNPVPSGTAGEVVITPLSVEGMPLVRYKTGDISFLIDEPCQCGRFTPRLGPILGRKKQMIKLKGTTFYPQSVYSVLDEMKEISNYYMIVTAKDTLSDELTIHTVVNDKNCTSQIIEKKLRARLRVKPVVIITDEKTAKKHIKRPGSRKHIRFIDRR